MKSYICEPRDLYRDELRTWLIDHGQNYSHFTTLASNNPMMSTARIRERLSEWDKRMSKLIVGGRWYQRPAQRPHWIAFLENGGAGPHWHLLFQISRQLPKARAEHVSRLDLGYEVEKAWTELVHSGSTNIQQINHFNGAIHYVTKNVSNQECLPEFVFAEDLR